MIVFYEILNFNKSNLYITFAMLAISGAEKVNLHTLYYQQ